MAAISVAHVDGRIVVRIAGDIDVVSAPRLAEALKILDGPLTVDCSQLEFMDASGLNVLAKAAQRHDGLILRNVSPRLRRLVALGRFDGQLHLDGTAPAKGG